MHSYVSRGKCFICRGDLQVFDFSIVEMQVYLSRDGVPTPRNEIEARDASLLQCAIDRATEEITSRHGGGPVTAKIQAHVIVATR